MSDPGDIDVSAIDAFSAFDKIFIVITPEGQMLRWNDRLNESTGCSDVEIESSRWVDFVYDEDRRRLDESLDELSREGAARTFLRIVNGERGTVPCIFSWRVHQKAGRTVIYGSGEFLADPRVDAPAGRKFDEHFRQTLRELPVFLYSMDRNLRCTWVSSVLAGFTPEDLVGKRPGEVLPEGTARRLGEMREQVLERGESVRAELAVTLEGEELYVDSFMAPQRGTEGQIVGLLVAFIDVTEQKKAEDQFRLLVDEVEEYAIFMLDPDGHISTWNQGARKIKGYREEDILGRHFSVFYTEEDRATGRPEEILEAATRDGYTETEGWRVREDGSRFWARVTVTALLDEQGNLRGYSKVTRDMTERREQEKKLRESERKYRRLFEEAQEAITITSPEGTVLDANPATCALNGYSREELIGMETTRLYVYPEERHKLRRRLEDEGEFQDIEMHLRRKDGKIIICRVSASALTGGEGNIEAFQSYARDITEQKKAQEALRESERKFRQLAEQSLVGICLIQDEKFEYVNPRTAEMFGYSVAELTGGMGPEDTIHPEDWPRAKKKIRRRLAGDVDAMRYEFRGVRRNGEIIHVEVYGQRISVGGRPAILSHMLDVTERRQLQREVLQIQEEERQRIGQDLHDGVGSQLSGVSMILSSIVREAEKDYPPIVDDLQRIKDLIKESGEDVRRISRGLNPVNLEQGGLPEALRRLAANTPMSEQGSCILELPAQLPQLPEDTATHLYWIAQEAVTNARKYSEADTICIRLERGDADLKLSVTDDGKGFDLSATGGNEGLGLRTMRYRAELIGGTLSITSNPDGTTIRCQLLR